MSLPDSPELRLRTVFAVIAAAAPSGERGSSLADAGSWAAIVGATTTVLLFVWGPVRWLWAKINRPKLMLDFDPDDPECIQKREEDLQLRVKVKNIGRTDATNIKLRLLERDPPGYDHYLRIRHDNTPPYTFSQRGTNCPGRGIWKPRQPKAVYFDVIFTELGRSNVVFQYVDAYLLCAQKHVPRIEHKFTLEVEGCELNGRSLKPLRERWQLKIQESELTLARRC